MYNVLIFAIYIYTHTHTHTHTHTQDTRTYCFEYICAKTRKEKKMEVFTKIFKLLAKISILSNCIH